MKTNAIVAGMRAVLEEADVVFCTTTDEAGAAKVQPTALGPFGEAEGLSMILARDAAEALSFAVNFLMRRTRSGRWAQRMRPISRLRSSGERDRCDKGCRSRTALRTRQFDPYRAFRSVRQRKECARKRPKALREPCAKTRHRRRAAPRYSRRHSSFHSSALRQPCGGLWCANLGESYC